MERKKAVAAEQEIVHFQGTISAGSGMVCGLVRPALEHYRAQGYKCIVYDFGEIVAEIERA